jgi:hypothetical protein
VSECDCERKEIPKGNQRKEKLFEKEKKDNQKRTRERERPKVKKRNQRKGRRGRVKRTVVPIFNCISLFVVFIVWNDDDRTL